MFALMRVPLVHHVGHVFFWGRHPEGRAIVLRVPCSSAACANLGVVAPRPTGAVGCDESFFASGERSQCSRWPGADGFIGVGVALEPACARGAPARAALDLRRELSAEGVSPRGGEAQELCHPL